MVASLSVSTIVIRMYNHDERELGVINSIDRGV